MKKINLGQSVQILANVGVLAGLLLLAFELSQNRDMMKAQTRNEITQSTTWLLTLAIDNGSFQNTMLRGREGEELSKDEQWQFERYHNAWFRSWENAHYQYRNGLYDEIEFSKQMDTWAASLAENPGVTSYWCRIRSRFSPEFSRAVDGLLTTYQCQ